MGQIELDVHVDYGGTASKHYAVEIRAGNVTIGSYFKETEPPWVPLRVSVSEVREILSNNEEWSSYATSVRQKHPVYTGEFVIDY